MIVAKRALSFKSKQGYFAGLSSESFFFLRRPLSSRKILRKYPLLATLHKTIDGALVGILISATVISSLALHSQNLWSVDFSRLEKIRELNHKLQESTALLEKHFLASVTLPKSMVITKSTDLEYIEGLSGKNSLLSDDLFDFKFTGFSKKVITHGY